MRDVEFREWLGQRTYDGKALTTVGNRVAWVRAVERALPELGFAETDLDAVHAAGRFDELLAAMARLRADWQSNLPAATVIAPKAENKAQQMHNARAALGQYARFANGDDPNYDDPDEAPVQAVGTRPFLLFDAAGAAFQPVRHGERDGRSVYKVKPRGAGNRADEALAFDNIADVARAVLVEGLLARVQSVHKGPVNYLGYGKQKLVRYELDPAIAAQINVPAHGSVADVTNSVPAVGEKEPEMSAPTNLILYGPPGTGKTYVTARKAVELCGEPASGDREALMARYRALQQDGRIAFVTFHQNYSYEEFVEGLRPETGGDDSGSTGFRLEPRPGIFREICALAEQARTRTTPRPASGGIDLSGRRFWKMGQGAIGSEDEVYDEAIAGGYIALGWGGAVDWSDARFSSFDAIKREWQSVPRESDSPSNWTQLWPFRCEMKPGDIVIVPYGNTAFRAIAEVTGDYYFVAEAGGYYAQRRSVRWLLTLDDPLPLDTIVDGKFTMRTLYPLPSKRVNVAALARLLPGSDDGDDVVPQAMDAPDQFVLIIDEINRANISKVFGELITLLEPDKRLGMQGALTVTLPYSKKRDFGVPANLHIIGTMNTADRSIALLDTALRRRFDFEEVMPQPGLLDTVDGIDLAGLLRTINGRVEYLFDREHQIGHAYFMGCTTRADVDAVMRHKVIPLLAEYFYEDWGKVARVLGDAGDGTNGFLRRDVLAPPPGLDPDFEDAQRYRWSVRDAFDYGAFASA